MTPPHYNFCIVHCLQTQAGASRIGLAKISTPDGTVPNTRASQYTIKSLLFKSIIKVIAYLNSKIHIWWLKWWNIDFNLGWYTSQQYITPGIVLFNLGVIKEFLVGGTYICWTDVHSCVIVACRWLNEKLRKHDAC